MSIETGLYEWNGKLNLQVIIASTRTGRMGHLVGAWFFDYARRHDKFNVELIDLAEVNLPLFNEPGHPRFGKYEHETTKAWSETVSRADAYVFVTPEYNFSAPPSLINALDYLHSEWAYKPVGFVSYGGVSAGTRSVQVTKQVVTALRMMPLPEGVAIPMFYQHLDEKRETFNPGEVQETAAGTMLNELLRWASALKRLREPATEQVAA